MNRMVSVRTEALAGQALDWSIDNIEGDHLPAAGQFQRTPRLDHCRLHKSDSSVQDSS
jgi:hypothetical protein